MAGRASEDRIGGASQVGYGPSVLSHHGGPETSTSSSQYVCVVGGSRDRYQVPLALFESGGLDRLVTDFYAPDPSPCWMPRAMARRRHKDLPTKAVRSVIPAMLLQQVPQRLSQSWPRVDALADSLLARTGVRLARRAGSNLYCYSSYLPRKRPKAFDGAIIDFEYHPRSEFILEILREDALKYPETAQSLDYDQQQIAIERHREGWRQADAIVCASTFTRRSLEYVGCPAEKITVIPYGMDPLNPDIAKRKPGKCHFLFVGQGVQRKGLHHLLRVWRQAQPSNARLTVVCYWMEPGIRELADDTSITLLPGQTVEALTALYRSADVFVMPSLIEGFGLTYLEALHEGCHVIGTANTGLPDLPLSGSAATILPAGDLDALAASLTACAERKQEGAFLPEAIAAEGNRWTWSDFRRTIGNHASATAVKRNHRIAA